MFADYVLPMGHGTERHDTQSYETHAGKWLGFRQPVRRVAMEKLGRAGRRHPRRQPGRGLGGERVLVRAVVADRPRRVARHPASTSSRPYRPGREGDRRRVLRLGLREPGARPAREGRRRRASPRWRTCAATASSRSPTTSTGSTSGRSPTPSSTGRDSRTTDRACCASRPTLDSTPPLVGEAGAVGRRSTPTARSPRAGSRRPASWSSTPPTMRDWGWPEHATPGLHRRPTCAPPEIDLAAGELVLMPTFRLPTMIHTRSGNAKYLNEITNSHPLWMQRHRRRGGSAVATGDLVRLNTEIGHFVARVWATEGIRPGVIALSHHMGRWRLHENAGSRWVHGPGRPHPADGRHVVEAALPGAASSRSSPTTPTRHGSAGTTRACTRTSPSPCSPTRGPACTAGCRRCGWSRRTPSDRYGDVVVDTGRSTRGVPRVAGRTRATLGPGGRRRPEFLMRPVKPVRRAYLVDEQEDR